MLNQMKFKAFGWAIILSTFSISPSFAQMNNEPYSFKGAGSGMSIGGKQALLNQKILGQTPDNLLRSLDGQLLTVDRGPGHAAIVSIPGEGNFLPGYKTDYKQGRSDLNAGVFNSFFDSGDGYTGYALMGAPGTSAVINAWTRYAGYDGHNYSAIYAPQNSVDVWTGMVQASY